MLAVTMIDPAQTNWASPVVFAAKDNRIIKLYAEYGKLIALIICDLHSFPTMNE